MRKLPTNVFNLSHEHLGTYEMGPLYPNLLIETVPGDSFDIVTEAFSRFEAMTSATMSRIDKFQYYFYVPKRLVFADYYEKYRFGGKDGTDTTVPPYMSAPAGGYAVGSLADHFGIPTGVTGFNHSAMPFRAYELIANDWILNDHLDTFFDVKTTAGADTTTNTSLINKKWEKDKFTSALPTPQLGGTPSYLPLGVSAPTTLTSGTVGVKGNGSPLTFSSAYQLVKNGGSSTGGTTPSPSNVFDIGITRVGYGESSVNDVLTGTDGSWYDSGAAQVLGVSNNASVSGLTGTLNNLTGTTDLTHATALSIPQLRISIVVQQFLERMNRGGTRPKEAILSTFGVLVPDFRLDRSDFITGSRTPVMITPVEQTSESGTTPQGTLTGRGYSAGTTGFRYHCLEDGYIIGLVAYVPRTTYSQGLDKLWSRETRYDEYLPDFAAVGDQEVKNKEIYLQNDSVVNSAGNPVNNEAFGYEDRYNEFRHMLSKVHGMYRPGSSMNDHTLTRQFNSLPQLNSSFVTADPSNRIFAVTSGVDHIEAQFVHHIRARRPLPRFGNPGLRKV